MDTMWTVQTRSGVGGEQGGGMVRGWRGDSSFMTEERGIRDLRASLEEEEG